MDRELVKVKKVVAICLVVLVGIGFLLYNVVGRFGIREEWITQNNVMFLLTVFIIYSSINIYTLGVYFILRRVKQLKSLKFPIIQVPIAVIVNTLLLIIGLFIVKDYLNNDFDLLSLDQYDLLKFFYALAIKDILIILTLVVTLILYKTEMKGPFNRLQKSILYYVITNVAGYILSISIFFLPEFLENNVTLENIQTIGMVFGVLNTLVIVLSSAITCLIFYHFFAFNLEDEPISDEKIRDNKVYRLKILLIAVYVILAISRGIYDTYYTLYIPRSLFNPEQSEITRRAYGYLIMGILHSPIFMLSLLVIFIRQAFVKNYKSFHAWIYILLISTQLFTIHETFLFYLDLGPYDYSISSSLLSFYSSSRFFSYFILFAPTLSLIVLYIRTLRLERTQKPKYLSSMVLLFLTATVIPVLVRYSILFIQRRHGFDYSAYRYNELLRFVNREEYMIIFFLLLLFYNPFKTHRVEKVQRSTTLFGENMQKLVDKQDEKYDIFGSKIEQ